MSDKVWAVIAGVGFIFIFALLFFFAADAQAKWEVWCHDQDGHVIDDQNTSVGYGFDSDGNMTTIISSNTSYYCLNEAGGIIDIK